MTVTPERPRVPDEEPVRVEAQSMRRLGRDTLVYLTGTILARLVSFIMLPVYTRYLTTSDYGILYMLDLAVDIAAILISAGATAGTMRFYFKAKTEEQRKDILATAFLLQIGLNALGTLLLATAAPLVWRSLLGGEGSPAMVRIAALNFTLGVVAAVPMFLFQARQQPGRFISVNLVKLALQLGLNIVFVVVLRAGPMGVLLSSMITHLVLGSVLGATLLRHTGIRFSIAAFRDFRRYGVPYQIAKAGTFILAFGDRFFLKHFHDLGVVGVYGLAYQFGFLLTGNVSTPFMRAWNPQRHMLVTAPKAVRDERYNRGFLYGSLLLVSVATGISLFIRPALAIMVTEPFRPAAMLVPIILAAYLMQAWTYVVELGIQVSERTKYSTYATWISVLLILVLYTLLVPRYAGLGAALATLAATTVRFLLHLHWSQRLWHVAYDWRPHLLLLSYGATAVVAIYVFVPAALVGQLALSAALFAAYAALVWTTVLDNRTRRVVAGVLRAPRTARQLFTDA